MSVECTGRNVEVTAAVRELARLRTQRLERRLGGPASVRVVLSHEKHRFGAEIIATHRRRRWKAQEETVDPRAAVALAFEKIDAQAKRDVEKRRDRKHGGSPPIAPADDELSAAPSSDGPAPASAAERRIVRGGQRSSAKPMTAEEAALRLEGSRLEFLVFRGARAHEQLRADRARMLNRSERTREERP